MNYNKSIKSKLYGYFKQRLTTKKSTKGYERTNCIYCGGDYTFGINVSMGKAHCFKCGERPSLFKLVMDIEGFETYQELRAFLNVQQEYEAFDRIQEVKSLKDVTEIDLPENFNLINYASNKIGKMAQSYLKKRGFEIDNLTLRGVGYCDDGEYMGYIVFPFYSRGKLIYFQGRRFLELAGPKMKNPNEEELGIGKTKIIYNEEALYLYNKVWVVESITNSLTLGDTSTATLGKSVSPYQISKIISSPCQKVIIGLDRDAIDKACYLGMQLVHYKKVKIIVPPTDEDINDMGKAQTRRLEKGSPYLTYIDILRLKNKNEQDTLNSYTQRPSSYSSFRGAS